jgi:gliding motility-associated-like protein
MGFHFIKIYFHTKTIIMKSIITCFFCLIFSFANADPQTFSGNMSVAPGSTESYTITWSSDVTLSNWNMISWSVSNGTIISQSSTGVTIEWGFPPAWQNGIGVIEVSEEFGGHTGTCVVNIVNFVEGTLESCGGILGPAAVAVNFGAGPNPGQPLPTGSITYTYNASCAISHGFYAVTNSTVGCNSEWLGLTEDHTPGDVNGYMLLVDGDKNSGVVYGTIANGLTQAFRYEFSVYVANLSPYPAFEKPHLQFEILDLNHNLIGSSGTYIVEYDPVNPWQKLSFMFDIPNGSSSVIVLLRNANNDDLGNDFVVDDLSFAPCYPPIIASFSNTSIIAKSYTCNSGAVNLFYKWPTTTIPFTNPSFTWQRNNNNPSAWVNIPGGTSQNFPTSENTTGIYKYRIIAYETSNPAQMVISNEITFFVQKMVVDAKTYDVVNCIPAPFILVPSYRLQFSDPEAPSSFTYAWSPGTYLNSTTIERPTITLPALPPPPSINSPTAAPPVIRIYNLTVSNTNYAGCIATNIQTVAQHNPRKVAIGNAFTPNGDGNNDLFRPVNIQDYPGSKFRVWNRWGNQVFYSEGPALINYSWNGFYGGQLAEQGVYTWSVDIYGAGCANNILNGAGSNSQTNNPFGGVMLIR